MIAATLNVLCKEAPLGYERFQGQTGILSARALPDTTFSFVASNEGIVTIKNATQWVFEKAAVTEPSSTRASGYVQVNDIFLWGQRVRCKAAPSCHLNPVTLEGTLQMPRRGAPPDVIAEFYTNNPGDTGLHWSVGREGWEFEKVVAGAISDRSDWATELIRLQALIGSRQRIVRSPWPDCVGQETIIEEYKHYRENGAIVSFEVRHDADVRRCGITEQNWNLWGFEPVVTASKTFDVVDHPKHYNVHKSGIECIEIMERLGSNLGSAFKCIWRADDKHDTPITDLKKALWYLRRELDFKWESSTTTRERLNRVVLHENYNTGCAMLAIFSAADSETGSVEKHAVIKAAIESVEAELRRLGT